MKKVVKLTESDLTRIIKRVISEQNDRYDPDRLYKLDSTIRRIERSSKFLHKYIKKLPKLKKEGSDEVWTKIPQVVWQNWV
jgi:hypothetical protein